MGYRDRMKKPEVPDVKFQAEADYCEVFGVMSALEEDEDVGVAGERTNYRQASDDDCRKSED